MNTIIRPYKDKIIDREFTTNLTLYDIWIACNRAIPIVKKDIRFKKFYIGFGNISIFGNILEDITISLVHTGLTSSMISHSYTVRYLDVTDPECLIIPEVWIFISLRDLHNYRHFIKIMRYNYERMLLYKKFAELPPENRRKYTMELPPKGKVYPPMYIYYKKEYIPYSIYELWKLCKSKIKYKEFSDEISIGTIVIKYHEHISLPIIINIISPKLSTKNTFYGHWSSNEGEWYEPKLHISLKDLYNYKKFVSIIDKQLAEIWEIRKIHLLS
jgi:hypothetical protein